MFWHNKARFCKLTVLYCVSPPPDTNSFMTPKTSKAESRLSMMLWALLTAMVLGPIANHFPSLNFTLDLLISLVFISGVYAVSVHRISVILTAITAIPMLILLWQNYLPSMPRINIIGPISTILFCGLIINSIYHQIKRTRRISGHTITGALTIYLLLGFGWAMLHLLLYTLQPAGYTGIDPGSTESLLNVFFYFSFVTLTTLGYGDISPVLEIHRSVTMLEAIIGQIYLVVVVAWLVGMKVAQDLETKSK